MPCFTRILCLCLLALATRAGATSTIYVATTGSDSTPCASVTAQTPRRSINGGAACLQPGGTLEVASGVYDELLVGQVDSSTRCQDNLAQIQQPCAALPNGPSPALPTRLVASGGGAVVSPRGRDFPGGGGALTLFEASRHLHIEGIRFIRNSASGSAAGLYLGAAQHVTIHRNTFTQSGIKNSSTSKFHTITANTILKSDRGCDQSTDPYPFCEHGMYLCGTDHTITDNRVLYAAYYGIQVSCEGGGIARIRLERNTVEYSYGVGIRCGGEDCTIASNVLKGNGTAITMSGSGLVAHNTIDSYTQGKGDPWGIYLTWGNWSSWTVVDNILTRQKSSFYAIGDYSLAAPDASKVHHNLCEAGGNTGCPLVAPASQVYTNVETDDYTLKAGSPAIQAGVSTTVTQDVQGVPYPSPPDLGAYSSGTPTPPQPEPPSGPLVLACEGSIEAVPGRVALVCTQQEGRR